jgi:hypothetical protein
MATREILQQKKDLLVEIYNVTKDTVLVGDENDGDRYVNMMDAREGLFQRLMPLGNEAPDVSDTESGRIFDEIKKITGDIIQLDKSNEPYVARYMETVRKSLKDMSAGKNMSTKYIDYIPSNEGVLFDSRN